MGLKATRKTISSPLLMPPWMPPERLVGGADAAALASEGVVVLGALEQGAGETAADFKALGGGRESMALARSASRRSKTGSPRPGGTPRTRHWMTPPTESPSARTCLDQFDHRGRGRRVRGSARGSPRPRPAWEDDRGRASEAGGCLSTKARISTWPPRREDFLRDGAGRHAADRLPGRAAAAAPVVADAVFGLVGVVGVGRGDSRGIPMPDEPKPEGSAPPPGGDAPAAKPAAEAATAAPKPAPPKPAAPPPPKPPAVMAATPWEGDLTIALKEQFGDQRQAKRPLTWGRTSWWPSRTRSSPFWKRSSWNWISTTWWT